MWLWQLASGVRRRGWHNLLTLGNQAAPGPGAPILQIGPQGLLPRLPQDSQMGTEA